eukprot:265089-Chlamydomonas_euryale.AAC.5
MDTSAGVAGGAGDGTGGGSGSGLLTVRDVAELLQTKWQPGGDGGDDGRGSGGGDGSHEETAAAAEVEAEAVASAAASAAGRRRRQRRLQRRRQRRDAGAGAVSDGGGGGVGGVGQGCCSNVGGDRDGGWPGEAAVVFHKMAVATTALAMPVAVLAAVHCCTCLVQRCRWHAIAHAPSSQY